MYNEKIYVAMTRRGNIKNHIPVKLREDLMLNNVEVIWLQVHLPHLKPILVGSCYRPQSANSQYLDNV